MTIQQQLQQTLPYDQKPESAYLRALRGLLPQGFIWGFNTSDTSTLVIQDQISSSDTIQDSILSSVPDTIQDSIPGSGGGIFAGTKLGIFLSVIATELYRFQERWYSLFKESIPGLSVELLPDWERVCGFPGPCIVDINALSIAERQANVHAKIFSRPAFGLSKPFYIDYAAILGYTITITEFTGTNNTFLVGPVGVDPFDIGSRVGDRLNNSSDVANVAFNINAGVNDPARIARLQCEIEQIKPSHVKITWVNNL